MRKRVVRFFILSVSMLLGSAQLCCAAVLFSDNFEASPDWQSGETITGNAAWPATWAGNPNVSLPPPSGWTSYRAAIPKRAGHEKTFVLGREGARNSGGKGMTYNIESIDYGTWVGGGLDVYIPNSNYQTLYLRLYLKYDPNTFHWGTVVPNFAMQKIGRISRFKKVPSLTENPQIFLSTSSDQTPTFYPDMFNNPAYNTPPSINPIHLKGLHVLDPGAGDAIATDIWELPWPSDGNWHCYEFRVSMNSAGLSNGEWEVWIDGGGDPAHHFKKSGLRWVDTSASSLTPGWNWVSIMDNSTIQPDAAYRDSVMKLFMDDVVVATHYSGPPAPPANVKAEGISSNSIKVTFQPGSNGANFDTQGYRVYYGTDSRNLNRSVTLASSATETTIADLATATRYHFAVTAFNRGLGDPMDNESLSSLSSAVTEDTIAPDLTMAMLQSSTRQKTQLLSGTVSDAGGIASLTVQVGALSPVAATVTGTTWRYTIPALNEGGNSITVTATDYSGNKAELSSAILLDTVAPILTMAPVVTPTILTSQPISGTVSDQGGVASVLVQVGGGEKRGAVLTGSAWSYELSGLQPGVATRVAVTALDTVGNESTISATTMASIGVLQAGDLSGDLTVGVDDAQTAMQMAVGMKHPDLGQLQRGDIAPIINGVPRPDGVIDTGDAVVILGIITGIVKF